MSAAARILHVQSDTGLSGGIAGYISTLIRSPAMRTSENLVVVPGRADDPARARVLYGDALTLSLAPNYGKLGLPSYLRQLSAVVRLERIDLIHAHALRSALPAALVSWRTGVPLIYTNHGLRFTQKPAGLSRSVFRVLEALICRQASAVVAIRSHDARLLQQGGLVRAGRLNVIETRIDPPRAVAPATRAAPARVIGVGSLIDVKRPDRFLAWVEALVAQGVAFDAVWAGDGPLRLPLESEVMRRRLPVRFVGQLDRSGLAQLYASASLLLLTSAFEVFPLSVLEAAANGVPVVAGSFDGIEDIVDSGQTGIVVDADDAPAVAAAIAVVLGDGEGLRRLSSQARARFAQRYAEPDAMAAQYAALYARNLVPRRA